MNNKKNKNWPLSRRNLLGAMGAMGAMGSMAAILPAAGYAQPASVLPLNTPGVDHLDIIVPDVAASAAFYMQVFNTNLHVQPLGDSERFFILLGELDQQTREVGYLAIGASRGRGTYIGHFCTTVQDWRRDSSAIFSAMGEAIEENGFGAFPGSTGFGGIFADPDGIEIQYLPSPDTLVRAAVPSDLVPSRQGMVTPFGVDHVHCHVTDLDRAAAYYTILYGADIRRETNGLVVFQFPASNTRLVLEEVGYEYGSEPGIAHFGIKVAAFDERALTSLLSDLGAQVLPVDEPGVFRFRDLDGVTVELVPS